MLTSCPTRLSIPTACRDSSGTDRPRAGAGRCTAATPRPARTSGTTNRQLFCASGCLSSHRPHRKVGYRPTLREVIHKPAIPKGALEQSLNLPHAAHRLGIAAHKSDRTYPQHAHNTTHIPGSWRSPPTGGGHNSGDSCGARCGQLWKIGDESLGMLSCPRSAANHPQLHPRVLHNPTHLLSSEKDTYPHNPQPLLLLRTFSFMNRKEKRSRGRWISGQPPLNTGRPPMHRSNGTLYRGKPTNRGPDLLAWFPGLGIDEPGHRRTFAGEAFRTTAPRITGRVTAFRSGFGRH